MRHLASSTHDLEINTKIPEVPLYKIHHLRLYFTTHAFTSIDRTPVHSDENLHSLRNDSEM